MWVVQYVAANNSILCFLLHSTSLRSQGVFTDHARSDTKTTGRDAKIVHGKNKFGSLWPMLSIVPWPSCRCCTPSPSTRRNLCGTCSLPYALAASEPRGTVS